MATLEQYMAEATNAFAPAKTAVQTQLGALDSNYATGEQKINKSYAQQQAQLNNQRNMAAESASMNAAGSGGSFGGAANLANRKYYAQSFVPAQTQLNTNKSNELDALRQNTENQRTNLNSQLANLDAQASQLATQQYWAAVEAEKQREAQLRAQREAQAAQNAYNRYLMDAMKNQGGGLRAWNFGNGLQLVDNGGQAAYYLNGNRISAGEFLMKSGANGANWNMWNDVWNNGVSTSGVGSDTVQAFNGGGRGAYSALNNKYRYLF
jgi:hypothetical protein